MTDIVEKRWGEQHRPGVFSWPLFLASMAHDLGETALQPLERKGQNRLHAVLHQLKLRNHIMWQHNSFVSRFNRVDRVTSNAVSHLRHAISKSSADLWGQSAPPPAKAPLLAQIQVKGFT